MATLIYIWLGTSVFFSIFGFLAGSLLEQMQHQVHKIELSAQALQKFGQIRNQMTLGFVRQCQNPLATVLEVFSDLQPFLSEQQSSLYSVAQKELGEFYKSTQNHFALMSQFHRQDGDKLSIQAVNEVLSHFKVQSKMEDNIHESLNIRLSANSFLQAFQIFLREIKKFSNDPLQIHWTLQTPYKQIQNAAFIYLVLTSLQPDAIRESSSWPLIRGLVELEGGQVWLQNKNSGRCQVVFSLPISQYGTEAASA